MNVHGSGRSNQREPVLKPISTHGKRQPTGEASQQHDRAPVTPGVDPSSFPSYLETTLSKLRAQFDTYLSSADDWTSYLSQLGSQRRIVVPVWAVAVLVLALGAVSVLVATTQLGNGGSSQTAEENRQSDSGALDEIEHVLALDDDELVSSIEWDPPRETLLSPRQQYLLEQGTDPKFEIRYAASEVERLQAELEAIQRNSAMLRSLARQQSGDLSAAYSSLEATQEQKDGALEDLQNRINELEGQIETVDDLARELRQLLGLPEPQSGVGGPVGDNPGTNPESNDPWMQLRSDIVSVEQQAGNLVFDLDEVNTEIQIRLALVRQSGLPRGGSVEDDLRFYEAMPLGWPVDGPITSRFGMRSSPFASGSEMHTGIDIAARTGTPVRATGAGTVRVAGNQGGYGLLVIIDHGRGVSTWYGHNSRLLVSPGQSVQAGQTIAEVGSTGRSTGPHVHYEVRIGNSIQDPMLLMDMQR